MNLLNLTQFKLKLYFKLELSLTTCKPIDLMRRGGIDHYSGWPASRPVGLEKLTLRLTQPSLAGVGAELGNIEILAEAGAGINHEQIVYG